MKRFTTAGLLLSLLFFPAFLLAQTLNQEVIDSEGQAKLLGSCNRAGLTQEPYQEWFQKGYAAYTPDSTLLARCTDQLDDLHIEVFLGTWCGDSKRGVPRFLKMTDELGIPESAIEIIALDNASEVYKQSPSHEEAGKLIHRVPTFIVYRETEEIGRIVETPVTSFEMDFAQIVHGLPAAPNYKIVQHLDQLFAEKGIPEDQKACYPLAIALQHDSWNDRELNTYGYVLMANEEVEKAIAVFTINAILHRSVPNVWDSLGEALSEDGQLDLAVKMYEMVLQLDPENENAKKQIALLEEKI